MFLDVDEELFIKGFNKLIYHTKKNLNCDLFFFDYIKKNNFADFIFGSVKKHWGILHGYKPHKIKYSWGFYSSHSTGFFIKRKVAEKIGFYNIKYKYHADYDYFYRLIVKNKMIISDGYNGTPTGFENICEDDENYTKWYVLHAEANAIMKVSASTQSSEGATLYITLSPCKECSKLIFQSGIKKVVYHKEYKDISGLEFLKKGGIEISHIKTL